MSGGAFEYKQYRIGDIREDIQKLLDLQGKELDREDTKYYSEDYFVRYPEEKFHKTFREDIQKIFREGVEALRIAEIYAHRIDWYISGDDGEDSLVSRLEKDLKRGKI